MSTAHDRLVIGPQLTPIMRLSMIGLTAALVLAAGLGARRLVATGLEPPANRAAAPPQAGPAPAALNVTIDLRFQDRADGGVLVYDAGRNVLIDELAPGSNAFMRGVLRALARDRAARAIGAAPPFRLSRGPDNRLTLLDTATGQLIALDAFGHTNAEAFGRFLGTGRRMGEAPTATQEVK